MPTYTYRCEAQRHEFDVQVPMEKRDDEQICPECGYAAWRIFTPINFVFRGALMSENAPPGAGRKVNSTI